MEHQSQSTLQAERSISTKTARFILIDQSAARELLEALGKEFINERFEKAHRLLRLCRIVVDELPLERSDVKFGSALRNDVSSSVRNSVRVVSVSARDGEFLVKRCF